MINRTAWNWGAWSSPSSFLLRSQRPASFHLPPSSSRRLSADSQSFFPGAKAGLFWAGVNALCITWTFFRLPEPKGRTCASITPPLSSLTQHSDSFDPYRPDGELDALFEHRVAARKFKTTDVSAWLEVAPETEGTRNASQQPPATDVKSGAKSLASTSITPLDGLARTEAWRSCTSL